jgi:hypothetical protein
MEMREHGKASWAAVTMHALRPRPEDGCSSTAVVVAADLREDVAQRRSESRNSDILSKSKTDEEQKGNIHHISVQSMKEREGKDRPGRQIKPFQDCNLRMVVSDVRAAATQLPRDL